ncbi:YraN family protein [Primorskyibacter sp. S87]|uniref:YraN family protein n=1 Tax=Primorskyibacter sp. S87 TaxID=3415126 RepID=UPI003C7C05A3
MAYHAGQAAENRIAIEYERRGYSIARKRWRGPAGEIDLITRSDTAFVFVEVKQGGSFDIAAERLGRRQMQRICASAEHFMATQPNAQFVDVRFDVALVDEAGEFRIIENAFGLN